MTMNLQLKFNSESIASSCLVVYRMGGIPQVLVYLQDMLRQSVDIVRINAIFCTLDGRAIINMGDTRKVTIPNKYNAPLVERNRILEPLIIDDLAPYKTPALLNDTIHNDVPFLQHRSLFRLPLFQTGNSIFVINFWSDNAASFHRSYIAELSEALAPLKDELLTSLSGIQMRPEDVSASPRMNGTEKVGLCPDLGKIRKLAAQAARIDAPVLIMGETGVGKESVADMIYELSERRAGPIVKINCGAITESLMESEFFGHEKGAFTGATTTRPGYFEMASGGVLFLDEIGELSLAAQTRLLRVLDNGIVCRVGGRKFFQVNTRVLAATNANLPEMVETGAFRKDLWYRLSSLIIEVPPLRERINDIAPLLRHFLQEKAQKMNLPFALQVDDAELHCLYKYTWPGNVRELEHVVERALMENFMDGMGRSPHFRLPSQNSPNRRCNMGETAKWPTLREHEDMYIRNVLEHCGGKLTGSGSATAILDIHYTTLKKRLEKMGIRPPVEDVSF